MKRPVKPIIGILAVIAAIIGLITSVFDYEIAEAIQPSPPVEEKIADFAVRVKEAVVAKLKDKEAVIASGPQEMRWHATIPKVAQGLGILALITAAISYIRGERRQYAVSAAGLGVVAIAWQAVMMSIGAIISIVIIFAILSALGVDISV